MQNVVAHMDGTDELAFVAVPLAITAVLLWVARRRPLMRRRPRRRKMSRGTQRDRRYGTQSSRPATTARSASAHRQFGVQRTR